MDTSSVKASVNDLGHKVRPALEEAKQKLEAAKQKLGRINGRVVRLIEEHPAACLLGALALGYLVARLARRQG